MKGNTLLIGMAVALVSSGLACGTTDPESPLIDLANRLYLDGSWTWADSMTYADYLRAGASMPHRGAYIIAGSATLEPVDSSTTERYVLTATATLSHVDSVGTDEVESWSVPNIEYDDTVDVRNDSIFGLAVEPIPPEANPNTNLIRWMLGADQLWCTNWLTDSLTVGNTDNCRTIVRWERVSPRAPE